MATRRGLAGSFWPTREQELLLRTVLCCEQSAKTAWSELTPTIDIQRLERGSASLLGLLYERLRDWESPEPYLPRLKGVHRFIWYGNQVGLQSLRVLVRSLRDAGIETIVLGESALILHHYGRHGVRPLAEPAVLLSANQVEEALRALDGEGWVVTPGGSGRHRRVARRSVGEERGCALYWRLPMELESIDAAPDERLRRALEPVDVLGESSAVLSTTNQLLCACLGGARNGSASRVQWVADAITTLAAPPAEIRWAELVATASARGFALRLRDALGYLSETFGAAVPPAVLDELRALPATRRELIAHRISGSGSQILGNLPATVGAHLASSQGISLARAVVTVPLALRREWGVGTRELPTAAARRARGAVLAARDARRHHA